MLHQLIQNLCPNGVEYKTLGEIKTAIYRGSGITEADLVEAGTPCIRYGEIYTTYGVWFNSCVSFTDEAKIKSKKYMEHGDILFAITGESVEDIAKSTAYMGYERCLVGGDIIVMKHNQNPKYLSYALSTQQAQKQKSKGKVKSKVVHSNASSIEAIRIPVPPIEIQEEVVRILDEYSEKKAQLIDALTAELTMRSEQVAYYYDYILTVLSSSLHAQQTVENSLPWKNLGDIAQITRGASPRPIKNYITEQENGVNWIKIGDASPKSKYIVSCKEKITQEGAAKSRFVRAGDFILSNSMSFGRPYILKIDGCIHDGWLSISDFEESVTSDYLYHILSSNEMQKVMRQRAGAGGAVKNLNADIVRAISIPVPDKSVQRTLSIMLDNLLNISSHLNEEISKEIQHRQAQYEYYRDKIFSFQEAN